MNRLTLWLGLPTLLLAGGVAVLAWLQNAARATDLSLNLGLWAVQTREPIAIPVLVASSAGAGFFLGMLLFGTAALRARSRARSAERQVALTGSGWAPAAPPAASPRADDDGWK